MIWKNKITEILNDNGPVTEDTFKNLKANKGVLLKNITNEIFGFNKKLPVDLLQCPLCLLEFKETRFLKRHMIQLDCKFKNYVHATKMEESEEGEEEIKERVEKDAEIAKEKADWFYGMSLKKKQGAEYEKLTGVVYGTLPSLTLSDQDQMNVLTPYDTVVPLETSIEKLEKWKLANENLIEKWYVSLPYTQEEIEQHQQNLIDRTKMFKTNNANTNDLFAHLSPEDRQVMKLYREKTKLAVKTKDDYCYYIFRNKKDTLWSALNRAGFSLSDFVANKGYPVKDDNDKYFNFEFCIPGREFVDTVDLKGEQWAAARMKINAYKSFLKFLGEQVGTSLFLNKYKHKQLLENYKLVVQQELKKELNDLEKMVNKGEASMSSKKVDKIVSEEGSMEELIENMNYVGETIIPLIQEKLTQISHALDQALMSENQKMSETDEELIPQIWRHVNSLMAIVLSTYDGNRRQNYLYLTLKGLATCQGDDILTMHVATGQNPLQTIDQRGALKTKTANPTISMPRHIYDFLIEQFMPIRRNYYRYYGITYESHKKEWIHFPVLSSGTKVEIGESGIPREVIAHLDGKNILNIIRSFGEVDESKINSFTTNRHAQVTGAWTVGVGGRLVFGHSEVTADKHYLESKEADRQEGNKKRAQAMAEQGLKAPEGFKVIDSTLQPEDYKKLYLEDLKEVALEKKIRKMKYNPVHTEKRNDCLTLELGRAIISSLDPQSSRSFTNVKYFPAVKERQEFALKFVSNPVFSDLQQEIIFTMSKFCEDTFQDKKSYGKRLFMVLKEFMKRLPHFYGYQVGFKSNLHQKKVDKTRNVKIDCFADYKTMVLGKKNIKIA